MAKIPVRKIFGSTEIRTRYSANERADEWFSFTQSFTHPESSHSILAVEAEDLFLRFDANADGFITEAEYLKDPFVEFDPDEVEDRRATFQQGLDADKVTDCSASACMVAF